MQVLIITENATYGERLQAALKKYLGQFNSIACSPARARQHLAGSFKPDLAVIYLNDRRAEVPGLVQGLKKLEKPAYVLLLADNKNFELVEEALRCGVDDFIVGKLNPGELENRLKKFISTYSENQAFTATKKFQQGRNSGQEMVKTKAPRPLARAFAVIANTTTGALLVCMAVLVIFLLQSNLTGSVPTVFGNQIYVVLSGSMSPTFDTGSLALVRSVDQETIKVGDIITYGDPDGGALTTHRVVEVMREEGLSFITRGDANNANDLSPVPAENVVGRFNASIPYLGYLINFSQNRQGILLMLFVPGFLIIALELRNIFKYLNEMSKSQHLNTG